MPDLTRYDDVLALLRDHASASPEVRLAVVGGSAATGRYDDHSDLDVELWVDGPPDAPYDALHALLHEQLTVDHVWEVLRERWPDARAAVCHRLGPVPAGEASIAIAVAASHRAAAFEACRYIIEAVKQRLPVWKKELRSDGSIVWVDPSGDPVAR